MFGFQQVLYRWHELQTLPLDLNERIFLSREFVQIGLRSQYDPHEWVMQEALKDLNHHQCDDYDRAIIILSTSKKSEIERHQELSLLKLSPFMRLQVLLIEFHKAKSIELQAEYLKMFNFLIADLSSDSQDLYLKIRPEIKGQKTYELQLTPSQRRLRCNSLALDIKVTPLQVRLLTALAAKSKLSLDEAAQSLWSYQDGDESIYHRLRMLVYKTNEPVTSQFGSKPFEITKEGVFINSQFQITINHRIS